MTPRKVFTPNPGQTPIAEHILEHPRAGVWASMGSGKTSAALNAVDAAILAGETHPTLVIAPLRVARSTWPAEARKWAHLSGLTVMPVIGSEKERHLALKFDAAIYTTNFEQVPWLVNHFGNRWPFRRVIVDESTKLKGFRLRQGTMRSRALASVAHTQVEQLVELTGTPAPNGLQDLWGQAWFLDKGARLGSTYTAFRERWFEKSYDGYSITPRQHAQREIQDALRDLCLTIDARDWYDLRRPIVRTVGVELPRKARRLYDDMEKWMFMELDGHEVEVFGAAARTAKCLQIASGLAWIDRETGKWGEVHDEKLQALEEIVEEAAGMPVLVAYQWVPSKERILKSFPQARFLDQNPQTEADWCAGKIPILVAHPQSAGHGLNLQDGGNILVYFDHWWNLEERMQILERIGPLRQRQSGYDRPVYVYNLVVMDTLDAEVIARTDGKRTVQEVLLDAMKRKRHPGGA